jgi:hypothetical protein
MNAVTIVRGSMAEGIDNVTYMELYSGHKLVNGRCGKTIVMGTTVGGSNVIYIAIC